MNKKAEAKLGDIRIDKFSGQPQICYLIDYLSDGVIKVTWHDYKTELLETTPGMCPNCQILHPLEHFRRSSELYNMDHEEKDTIKIRYAYIGSPTNLQIDPAYYESIQFKVLTIEDLEQRSIKTTLEELITDGNEASIKVLGRDRCTGRVDMNGKYIYEGDIIRWYTIDIEHNQRDEIVTSSTCFYGQEPEIDCEVICTIYDKKGDRQLW